MKRRELLQQLAIAGTFVAPPLARATDSNSDRLGTILPQRTLGKSGIKTTCLGLGGFHIGNALSEADAQAIIEKALECGIRFFDTAESYHQGLSEERYGRFLVPRYREDIFLMTKSTGGDSESARQHLEGSLRRLNTDVIDLWQIHSLKSPDDTDKRLAQGVLETALKARDEGKIRHIGFTGHSSPYAHLRMMEHQNALDACITCQMPINPVDAASEHSFIGKTLPKLLENNIGALAMKTLADGRFFASKERRGKVIWTSDNPVIPTALSVEDCITFALSLPISVLITGCDNPGHVEEKAAMARNFTTLSKSQRMALVEKVTSFAETGTVEYYKNDDLRAGRRA